MSKRAGTSNCSRRMAATHNSGNCSRKNHGRNWPVTNPCYFGIDTPVRNELIASSHTVDEIATYLRVDSLAYLSLDNLLEATGGASSGLCTACLSGDYPTIVPLDGDKFLLEKSSS